MAEVHGFELIKEQEIPELKTKGFLFRHIKTGAELLSLENEDENKVFGITFRTPPADSTGVAHIMEHAVLCGSKKYRVKEPFVELIKSSLNTFLNAFTFPDKTCYPVASQNLTDFYNLAEVYLDAVFFPLISPPTFAQEGWHYELEQPNAPLVYKGVVYNEMKGAYSSPDRNLMEASQQSLFPDNTYGFESGGHPHNIPELTYEQFKNFHETYYHPSNARIYFYGDDNREERLKLVDSYLQHFEAREIDSTVPLQSFYQEPKRIIRSYAIGESEDKAKKGMVTVNFLLPEVIDMEEWFAISIMTHVLLGTPASPLYKALIDSGLGEDVTGVGLESDLRQGYFSTGLKGIDPKDADRVEALILDTLKSLAAGGIDPAATEASINTIEFGLREQNTGSYPRGLALMLSTLTTWLHDRDPLEPLLFEKPFSAVKQKIRADKRFIEGQIEKYLLQNNHRTTVILEPDPALAQQEEQREKKALADAKSQMTAAQIERIIEDTQKLKALQETPDDPAALAKIPRLQLEDLDKKNKKIPKEVIERDGSEILYHDLFTNGIVYFDLGFDLRSVPQTLLPLLPLFSRALKEMGTTKEDFVRFSQRIGRETGGVRTSILNTMTLSGRSCSSWLILRGKAMVPQTGNLLAILTDMIKHVDFSNRDRFMQMLLEEKASEEASLVPGGHGVVSTRIRSLFHQAGWLDEQLGGVSYLFFLRKLVERVKSDWPGVQEALEQIRTSLLTKRKVIANLTLDEKNWQKIEPAISDLLQNLPESSSAPQSWQPEYGEGFEGLTIPAQVNYVGKGTNLYDLGYDFHGSAFVISKFLRTTWLWERVRMQGGAYGGFCSFDRYSGVFSFLSYRDPNLLKTLANYDEASRFLREVSLEQDDVVKSIIGTIGDIDTYRLPDAKGYVSMFRHLAGDSDENRQKNRDEILSTQPKHFRAFADLLQEFNKKATVVVLGSESAIEAANKEKGDWLKLTKVM